MIFSSGGNGSKSMNFVATNVASLFALCAISVNGRAIIFTAINSQ